MTQLIGAIGKENVSQNTDQAEEKLNNLLKEYKNELLNFKLKANNLEPVRQDDNRFKTQVISKNNEHIRTIKSRTSKSPGKKGIKKPSKKDDSKSRSISPFKHFESEYDCMQCALNECGKHGRKTEFLEELLSNSSPLKDMPHKISLNENK